MKYTVAFTPEAEDDLLDLYNYIADHSSTTQAMRYIERIERSCMSLTTMPDRGTRRDDLCPGLIPALSLFSVFFTAAVASNSHFRKSKTKKSVFPYFGGSML
jgi:plasmid stabilization system protein ParE